MNKEIVSIIKSIGSEKVNQLYNASKLREICTNIYKSNLKSGKELKHVAALLAHVKHDPSLLKDHI